MSPQIVHTLNDIAPSGWKKMQLHVRTQRTRQKDMKFVNCLNKICTTIPLEGSEEDRMLQSHELNLIPIMKTIHMMQCMYMHKMCTVMNVMKILQLLPGREFTNIATDSKKDDFTELANVTVPTNPLETGNLQKVFNCTDQCKGYDYN